MKSRHVGSVRTGQVDVSWVPGTTLRIDENKNWPAKPSTFPPAKSAYSRLAANKLSINLVVHGVPYGTFLMFKLQREENLIGPIEKNLDTGIKKPKCECALIPPLVSYIWQPTNRHQDKGKDSTWKMY